MVAIPDQAFLFRKTHQQHINFDEVRNLQQLPALRRIAVVVQRQTVSLLLHSPARCNHLRVWHHCLQYFPHHHQFLRHQCKKIIQQKFSRAIHECRQSFGYCSDPHQKQFIHRINVQRTSFFGSAIVLWSIPRQYFIPEQLSLRRQNRLARQKPV